MINLKPLLAELRQRKIKLWVEGERLRYGAPKGALTPTLRKQVVQHKADLILFLQQAEVKGSLIQPISRGGELPLSFAQQRLWFLDQLEGGGASYNMPGVLRIEGVLNLTAFAGSLNEIVRRHEILRTTFPMINGGPIQQIATDLRLDVPLIELSDWSEEKREEEIQRLALEEQERPFDLAKGPLLRASLLRLSQQTHILLLTIHHIVSDGWSINLLINELSSLYEAFSSGKASPLPDLAIQYADFAHWQRQWLSGNVLEKQVNYWKEQLAGAPALLQLPIDRPRPRIQSVRGKTFSFTLSKTLSDQIRALSGQVGATLFMTLQAAFATLLFRYSAQEDILMGTPIANRTRAEIEPLIGLFINTLVLRTTFQDDPTFFEVLNQVRFTALDAYKHQDLPFELLVERLQPARSLSHSPFFQVMFILQDTADENLILKDLTLMPMELDSIVAKFDLTLNIDQNDGLGGMSGWWEYNCDLFNAETIERMTGHFQTLLAAIVENPFEHVSRLSLPTPAEEHQLLVTWNETDFAYPNDKSFYELFEYQAEQTPDAVAVAFASHEQGEEAQLTYRELNARANQLAHHLIKLGVGPDVFVGICIERSLEMMVGLLGILKAGGAYVPLDPDFPTERLAFMLSNSEAKVLVSKEGLLKWHGLLNQIPPTQKLVYLDSDWPLIAQESTANPMSDLSASHLAYCIYTSGSTGKPKGVQINHQSLTNFLVSMQKTPGLSQEDTLVAVTTISFDIAALELYLPLITGAKVVLVSRDVASDGLQLANILTDCGATIMQATPATWRILLAAGWTGFDKLKTLCGGEALPRDLANELLDTGTTLWNMYGPTETTIWSTTTQIDRAQAQRAAMSIGRPIANTQIYILDRHKKPVPIGVPGDLYIGGDGVAQGYLKRPALNQERFIPNPFVRSNDFSRLEQRTTEVVTTGGARIYNTGDQARYLPDGQIEFLGRNDHQVKIRGFRIELEEIEAVLNGHPNVRQAVVLAREDEPGNKRLVAYLVREADDSSPSPNVGTPKAIASRGGWGVRAMLREYLARSLPAYMVPNIFVRLDTMPLTPNRKIDRNAIAALPAPEREVLENAFVAPRTLMEERLAAIWRDLLNLERVGVHDNFFELGGHSLLATQVVSRIRNRFSIELPLRHLFEYPTVSELADALQASTAQPITTRAPITRVSRDGDLPLSFAQQRLWFIQQLEGPSATYNMPSTVRLIGALNINAFEQSLNEIVRRHESLRTTFSMRDGHVRQVIAVDAKISLPVVNLTAWAEAEQESEIQRLALEEEEKPFDLAHGPLLRVTLLRLGDKSHIFLLTMHHIISDGWSIGVFIREFSTLYEAYCKGQPTALPDLAIQYADFAHWQRKWLSGEVLEGQLAYWKKQLAGAPALLQLPTDRPRPHIQTFRGGLHSFTLSKALSKKLKALAVEAGATLFMILQAAFATLLYRYSAQEDILVGTPIANRNRAEIEPLIGCFVNTLVLRTAFKDDSTFQEVLNQVRNVTLDAYNHQDLPFELLVEHLQPARTLSHSPLFQVMFILQNMPEQTATLSDLTLTPLELDSVTAKFDLTLTMADADKMDGNAPDQLSGWWEYNRDLFDPKTIERMAGHFQMLLTGIVANPVEAVASLSLLTPAEEHQLLVTWNQTERDYPTDKCLHQLFEEQVVRTPDAIAVIYEHERLTYDELNQNANRLAHQLIKMGVGPEVMVGICIERSLEMMIGLLAILKAGGAYVPLDPAYPGQRLAFMLQDAKLPLLLTTRTLLGKLPDLVQAAAGQAISLLCLDESEWRDVSQHNPLIAVQPHHLAYCIYTSGSTGKPKGTLIEHRGLTNYLSWSIRRYSVAEGSGAPVNSSIGFDATITSLFSPLLVGQKVVLLPEAEEIEALSAVLLNANNFSLVKITPAHLEILRQLLQTARGTKAFIIGGEALFAKHVEFWRTHAKNVKLINEYGPTETVVGCCVYDVPAEKVFPAAIPIGRPIANTQLYILDRHLQPVPIGVPGELYIGGAGVARGYLNRPALTKEKFIPDPFSIKNARLYKTGDLCRYLPDGNLEFLGRIDHQVKVRGFRIELGEIEAVLSQHEAVQEVVVITRESKHGKQLVAYIVLRHKKLGKARLNDQLRGFLQQKLPEHMVPNLFVHLDAMPLTPNGKINRRGLPAPESRSGLHEAFVAPRDVTEQQLAFIWQDILGVHSVGVHDNFFNLGGHSLLAVRLMARIQQQFGQNLPLATLFQRPTVGKFANLLREQSESISWSSLVPIQSGGKKPAIFAIPGAGGNVIYFYKLAHHLGPQQPFYGLQAVGLDGEVEPYTTVEEMAAHYIKEIYTVQPKGPYRLAGHSLGGKVAFEMAQQLQQMGHEVAQLVIFDTPAPEPTEARAWSDAQWLTDLAEAIEEGTGKQMNVSYDALLPLGPDEQLLYFKERLELANLLPADSDLKQVRGTVQVYKTGHQTDYMPTDTIPTAITLFRSEEGLERFGSEHEQPTWGWEAFGNVEPIDVPGDHITMLAEPHVEVLAEQLAALLQAT